MLELITIKITQTECLFYSSNSISRSEPEAIEMCEYLLTDNGWTLGYFIRFVCAIVSSEHFQLY